MNLQADLMVLLPELILAVGAMALLLAGAIWRREDRVRPICLGRDRCCCWRPARPW